MREVIFKTTLSCLLCIGTFIGATAQGDMITREEKLVGSHSEFIMGVHTGLFDANQTIAYPFNFGILTQYNYTPDVLNNWFLGVELGAFFARSGIDDNGRELRSMISHLSIYPGFTFELSKKEYPEEEEFKNKLNSRKFKIAAGLTLGFPIASYSAGSSFHVENMKNGVGFSVLSSYDLPNRISLIASATRIGADMDGFGYDVVTGDRLPGNEHKVTYWLKVGVTYDILGR